MVPLWGLANTRVRWVVSVSGLEGLVPRQRDAVVVRMMAKLRKLDSTARGIDIVLAPPGAVRPMVG
jgi:hypothetical protein